jgi:ATP-dependent DNA ligase
MRPKSRTNKSAKSATATGKAVKGFTDEERAAMKERARELKAEARRGPRAKEADGESDVLAKIAEMSEPDRVRAACL